MTEYDPSPEAIEEYYNSRSRTAAWIHRLEVESLRAPSECPTRVDDALLPSRPPSEAGSSRSVPPKMLLRFNDGRPDVPIPVSGHSSMKRISHRHHDRTESMSRPRTLPHPPSHHSRPSLPDAFDAAWEGSQPHSRHRKRSDKSAKDKTDGSRTPRDEHSVHTAPKHSRSKSLPQDKELRAANRSSGHAGSSSSRAHHPPPTPPMPIPPSRPSSHGHRSVVPNMQLAMVPASPWHQPSVRAPSSSRHQQQRTSHSPPAIVYAPSHHSQANYSPPAMYPHPPARSPRHTMVSRSSPERGMPASYPPTSSPPLSDQSRRPKRPRKREGDPPKRTRQQRSHSVPLNGEKPRRAPRSPSRSSRTPSEHSGSTYYVIPNAGQKVHVINPDASTTIYTATSTTQRSPTSPRSLKSLKMSFFQRLINMSPKFQSRSGDSKASAKSSSTARKLTNKLLRRHSLSGGSQASS
ncbi:hypothetical protein K525DRAFT_266962 [Schizophyllum commune Loenen D]|nr:hypothetical protein K525DRAFT_266962 [Schizophyllum commune Loenen D]